MHTEILNALPANHPWRDRIIYLDSTTSTNDVLKQLALQGAEHGTVLIAGHQTQGKGRMGRTFLSPKDSGIYMSVLLRPQCCPTELMHLTCAAGYAVCNAIEAATGLRPGIKWINDIVYEKRKIGGILTQMGLSSDGKLDYAIIGIGINCNQKTQDFPPELREIASSLELATRREMNRCVIAAELIQSLEHMSQHLISQKQEIMVHYRKDCITIGQEVQIIDQACIHTGKALDVDEDGALIVQYANGKIRHVNSGEVSVRGMYGYI